MISIEDLRQFRIGEYAIFDFAVAFIGVYLFAPLLSKIFLTLKVRVPKMNWIYLTLPIAIIVHLLSGTITPMTRDFIDIGDYYILKIVIIILFIFGIKGIKIIKE